MTTHNIQENLRARLLERLARLSAPADTQGATPHGATSGVRVFGYCVQVRERVARTSFENPAVVVALSGTKEVWRGDVVQRFGSGVLFVIPAGLELDFVNIPGPHSGRYESLCITVDPDIRQLLRASVPGLPDGPNIPASFAVSLTDDLVEAYGHAAATLSEPDLTVAGAVARHRLLEILLLLSQTHVARALIAASRVEQVEAVFHADPAHPWRV